MDCAATGAVLCTSNGKQNKKRRKRRRKPFGCKCPVP
jgi:hypothetical protein